MTLMNLLKVCNKKHREHDRSSACLFVFAVFFGIVLSTGGCERGIREGSSFHSSPSEKEVLPAPERVTPTVPADHFQLTQTDGGTFDSSSLLGKVWMGSIFFANCPGPCFRENQAVAEILRELNSPDFIAVSITCDPDNDTPEVLGRYADRFEANPENWKFLTGPIEQIRSIANTIFFLPAEVGVHSERGVVFDRQGRLRGSYHLLQADRVAAMKKLIAELLAEPAVAQTPLTKEPAP